MRHHNFVRATIVLLLATAVSLLSACASTRNAAVIALPNGFYFQKSTPGQVELVRRDGRRVLRGPVAAYAVSGEIVAGALGEISAAARACTNDCPFKDTPDTRYFVLDTRTGYLTTNLSATEWRGRLDSAGVPPSFRIATPFLP